MRKRMTNKWRCGRCGYALEADAPPEVCPGCREHCDFVDANPYVPIEGQNVVGKTDESLLPVVVPEKCTGCLECIEACPIEAIEFEAGKAVIDVETCDGDGICIPVCPEGAIVLRT